MGITFKSNTLVAVSILSTQSLFAQIGANAKVHCEDAQSFGAGRISVNEIGNSYQVLLRGNTTHGRAVTDLVRDLNLDLPNEGYLAWVSVTFKKEDCQWLEATKNVAYCGSSAKDLVFYDGWREDDLTEIARVNGELRFYLEQLTSQSIHGPSSLIRAKLDVSIPNVMYLSNIGVEMGDAYCR